MLGTIAIVTAGVFIILLGYLIWFKKMLFLIIGYSDNTFYGDKNKYAKRMGLLAIILGILVIIMPFINIVLGEVAEHLLRYFIFAYVVFMIVVANYWRFRL